MAAVETRSLSSDRSASFGECMVDTWAFGPSGLSNGFANGYRTASEVLAAEQHWPISAVDTTSLCGKINTVRVRSKK